MPFFAFPGSVRRIIYTTNAIEALNSKLRRAVRTRGHFPNDVLSMPSREPLARLDEILVDMALVTAGKSQQAGKIVHREPLVWPPSWRFRL